MSRLHHLQLSPFCRKVRLALAEKGIEVALIEEKPWERRPDFLALSPGAQVPVYVARGAPPLSDSTAIVEYLEDVQPDPPLLPGPPIDRAEARRLSQWFDGKFHTEATAIFLHERIYKRMRGLGHPDSARLRLAAANLRAHLDYLAWMAERRRWLAGDRMSVADFAAAAHLSVLDYTADVPWDHAPPAKDWYARIKSRPAFRELLTDRAPATPPSAHYADLDF